MVRSVEPESTTTIWSANHTLASVRARFASSFLVMMATESVCVIGVKFLPVCALIARHFMMLRLRAVYTGSAECDRGIAEMLAQQALDERHQRLAGLGKHERARGLVPIDLKLVVWADIQIWRTGVLGVTTNLLDPSSNKMLLAPLLSSNSKLPEASSAAISACFNDSRARSDSRRKVVSSIMGLV